MDETRKRNRIIVVIIITLGIKIQDEWVVIEQQFTLLEHARAAAAGGRLSWSHARAPSPTHCKRGIG